LRVVVPSKHGTAVDVTLTEDTAERLAGSAFFGCSVGRVANRIGNSHFELEGQEYKLFANSAQHSLHGGENGFNKKIWRLVDLKESPNEIMLVFSYTSPDKEEGYPGKLEAKISYHIQPLKIWWEFEATTDKTTIVNLTNHSYWNLDGVGGTIDTQEIQLESSLYNPVDGDCFPTGEMKDVGEDLDMKKPRKFLDIFSKFGDVDNNFHLNGAQQWVKNQRECHLAAKAFSPTTGISMSVSTSDPCVQLYTGNFLKDACIIAGNTYQLKKHYGFCLETQRVPNAINTSQFRESVILRSNEQYYHKTIHEFNVV